MLFADEDSKTILIALLNSVLVSTHPITKARVLNPQIPVRFHDDKGPILDILAELDDGRLINIEMQMASRRDTRMRAYYYSSRLFGSQLRRGKSQNYALLKPTHTIFFLNHRAFPEIDEPLLLHTLHYTHNHRRDIVYPELMCHFIELPTLFAPGWKPRPAENLLALWSKFLLNSSDNALKEAVMAIPEISQALEKLKQISASEEKRELVRMREKARLDWQSAQAEAKDEGIEIGRQEGIEIGRKEGNIRVIQLLLSMSSAQTLSVEDIHAKTHIPLEEIEAILKTLKP